MGPWKLDGGYELCNPLHRCARGRLYYERAWVPSRPATAGRPARESRNVHAGECLWVNPKNAVGEQQLLLVEAFYRRLDTVTQEATQSKVSSPREEVSDAQGSASSTRKQCGELHSAGSDGSQPSSSQRSSPQPSSSQKNWRESSFAGSCIPVRRSDRLEAQTPKASARSNRRRPQWTQRKSKSAGSQRGTGSSLSRSATPHGRAVLHHCNEGFMLGRVFYWREDKKRANRKSGATELIITNDIATMPLDAIDGVQHVSIARPSPLGQQIGDVDVKLETKRFFCQTRFNLETMRTHPLLTLESLDAQFETPLEESRREYCAIFKAMREARLRLKQIKFYHSTTFLAVSQVELENDYDSGLEVDSSWRDKESEVQMRQLTDVSPSEREFFLLWNRSFAAAPMTECFLDSCRRFARANREKFLDSKHLLLNYKLHLATLCRRSLINPYEAHMLLRLVLEGELDEAPAIVTAAVTGGAQQMSKSGTVNDVVMVYDDEDDESAQRMESEPSQRPPELFAGIVLCTTGLSVSERAAVFALAQQHCAVSQRHLDKGVTHLLVREPGGLKWLFAKRRTELAIETVRPEWVQACVDSNKLLDCAEFRVQSKSSKSKPGQRK